MFDNCIVENVGHILTIMKFTKSCPCSTDYDTPIFLTLVKKTKVVFVLTRRKLTIILKG